MFEDGATWFETVLLDLYTISAHWNHNILEIGSIWLQVSRLWKRPTVMDPEVEPLSVHEETY
jgi:hypothetical protein